MDETKGLGAPTERPADHQLIVQCLAGDPTAWEALLHRYERMIHSVTARFAFQMDDRHDVFQSVCCEVLKNLPALVDTFKLRSWIMTITIRECNDLIRKKYRQRRHDSEETALHITDPSADTLGIYLQAERDQLLREAVEQLPERCRQLIH